MAKIILKSKKLDIPVDVRPKTNPAGVIIANKRRIDHAFILEMLVLIRSVINATATGN